VRIERFWRDCREKVFDFYKFLFHKFETNYGLNFDRNRDLFCLHFVFLKRINEHLENFRQCWNKHTLRTVGSTPEQMCYLNRHLSVALNPSTMTVDNNIVFDNQNDSSYSKVNTEPVHCELNQVQLNFFKANVNKLDLSHVDEFIMFQFVERALVIYDICVNL